MKKFYFALAMIIALCSTLSAQVDCTVRDSNGDTVTTLERGVTYTCEYGGFAGSARAALAESSVPASPLVCA